MDNYRVIGIIFLMMGIILCSVALYLYREHHKFRKYGVKAKGTVKGIEQRHPQDMMGANEIRNIYYFYTIEYLGMDGTRIYIQSQDGIRKKYALNEEIDIIYNSKKDTEFIIVGQDINRTLFTVFIILGLVFISASVLFLYK